MDDTANLILHPVSANRPQAPEPINVESRIRDDYTLVGYPTGERRMATPTLTYDAKVDSKKRITLRGTNYEYYNVQELDDGRIILSPRVLVDPFEISANTLKTMDQSMENFKAGKVSEPLKL